jgi:hypothetical protein
MAGQKQPGPTNIILVSQYDAEELDLISIARNVATEMPSNKDLLKPKGNIFLS